MSTAANLLRFCLTSWKLNLAGAMQFRMSFLLTAGMMMVNNTVWIFFWTVYFQRFPIVSGWTFTDVMMMWSVVTAGFGLSYMLFGNSLRIANIVATGQLDLYLAQPKPVLLHVLTQSLAFFIGNAEGLGHQFFNAFITFTTYPTGIFKGWGRLILFTVVPAGFISYMPIGFLRAPEPLFIAGTVTAAAVLSAVGLGTFYRGLKRYSSGNTMGIRS